MESERAGETAVSGADAARRVKKHPIRGAIFGLFAGLGLGLLLISHSIMVAGALTPALAVVLMFVLGITVGVAGPARQTTDKDRLSKEARLLKD